MARRALAAIGDVLGIRIAQRETARAAVIHAQQHLQRVRAVEDGRREERDAAERSWQEQLQARRPDPGMLRLAADWLIAREGEVEAARLDTRIAHGEHEAAELLFGQALARLDATHAFRSQLKREAFHLREAHDLAEAADRFVQAPRR